MIAPDHIVLLGDSYANGHAPDGTVGHLADALCLPEVNRLARSGSTAIEWASDKDGMLTRALYHPAPVVVMSLGGNDAFAALKDGVVTLSEIVLPLSSLYYVMRILGPRRRIIVMLYPDPYCGARPQSASYHRLLIGALRALVAAVPYAEPFAISPILGPQHFDGSDIHPLPSGYRAIASAMRKTLFE